MLTFIRVVFFCSFCITTCICQSSTQELLKKYVIETLDNFYAALRNTDYIRHREMYTPAYEIGHVLKNMEEAYRRMVDLYNATLTTDLYNAGTTDHIMFLRHVESYFWVVDNLANALHELEKKYKHKKAGMFEQYLDFTVREDATISRIKFMSKYGISMTTTTKRPKQTWWPLDYGFDQGVVW